MEIEGTRIFDGRKVLLKETDQALTPFGGMVVLLEFLNKIGFVKKVMECIPIIHRSPNLQAALAAIPTFSRNLILPALAGSH